MDERSHRRMVVRNALLQWQLFGRIYLAVVAAGLEVEGGEYWKDCDYW